MLMTVERRGEFGEGYSVVCEVESTAVSSLLTIKAAWPSQCSLEFILAMAIFSCKKTLLPFNIKRR